MVPTTSSGQWSCVNTVVAYDFLYLPQIWTGLPSAPTTRQKVLLCRCVIRNKSIIFPSSYFSHSPPHPNPRTHHPHTVHVPFARTSSTCAVHMYIRGLWGLVVVRLSWLSGRALAAQARGVLDLTPSDCQPFHFSPHNIRFYFLYLFVTCGTASKWRAYHLHIHLRMPCCSYLHSFYDVFFYYLFSTCFVCTCK